MQQSTLIALFIILKCVVSINIPDDVFMSGILNNCGDAIANKNNVYIRSHVGAYTLGSMVKYGDNKNCELTFNAGAGKRVLVHFLKFDMESKVGDDCVDGLSIYDLSNVTANNCSYDIPDNSSNACNSTTVSENSTVSCNFTSGDNSSEELCNSNETDTSSQKCNITVPSNPCNSSASASPAITECGSPGPSPFVSSGPELKFKFYTNSQNHFSGFQLLVTAFRQDENCTANEFKCDSNRCISKHLKCDTLQHCVDGTDENSAIAGCTVIDQIFGYVFGLGQLTIITICVLGGVAVLLIVSSVILYRVCCKKPNNAVEPILESISPQPQATSSGNSKKNEKKVVTVVEPVKVTLVEPVKEKSQAPPASNKKALDKKSKKKTNDDDFW